MGVVFRGNLWLDGVMRVMAPKADITDGSVEMITTSRHHPQIRAILIHGGLLYDGITIDACSLSKEAMRPVIALNLKEEIGTDDTAHTRIYALDTEGEETRSCSIGIESRHFLTDANDTDMIHFAKGTQDLFKSAGRHEKRITTGQENVGDFFVFPDILQSC